MSDCLREQADFIIKNAIEAVKPDEAVKRALADMTFPGDVYIVAAGKAAYQMTKVASTLVDYNAGVVVTKYNHVMDEIERVSCYEAGHPIPDENGIEGTQAALEMTANLTEQDTVLFLLSGGGSALFEKPLIPLEKLQEITSQLLARGADITEINTIRKRLSMVKGGKFAAHVAPAKVYAVILSDIIGDPIDMIASGPTVSDASTSEEAAEIMRKYDIATWPELDLLIRSETPKTVLNATNTVIGSVRWLCNAARDAAVKLGYEVVYLSDCITCEARDLGEMLGSIALSHGDAGRKLAFLCGGETVVHLKGDGLGGRNQEIAVGAMQKLNQLKGQTGNACVFSVGSDGTDGPTDAAGGYADCDSYDKAVAAGLDVSAMQENNDCYHLLEAIDGLVITGPTGTNVNDFSMVLIQSANHNILFDCGVRGGCLTD